MNCSASIVYSNSWLGQTSGITSAAFFSPSGAGLFRINLGGDVSVSSPSNQVVTITVNIKAGFEQGGNNYMQIILQGFGEDNNPPQAIGGATGVIQILPGYVLSLETTVSTQSGATLNGYDLYVVIEQLA